MHSASHSRVRPHACEQYRIPALKLPPTTFRYFNLPPASIPGTWTSWTFGLGRYCTSYCSSTATACQVGLQSIASAGGSGSGTPFHMHRPAVNVLATGTKRWLLRLPCRATYSVEPIFSTLVNSTANGAIQFSQKAGEIVVCIHLHNCYDAFCGN